MFVYHFLAADTPLSSPLTSSSGLVTFLQSQKHIEVALRRVCLLWCSAGACYRVQPLQPSHVVVHVASFRESCTLRVERRRDAPLCWCRAIAPTAGVADVRPRHSPADIVACRYLLFTVVLWLLGLRTRVATQAGCCIDVWCCPSPCSSCRQFAVLLSCCSLSASTSRPGSAKPGLGSAPSTTGATTRATLASASSLAVRPSQPPSSSQTSYSVSGGGVAVDGAGGGSSTSVSGAGGGNASGSGGGGSGGVEHVVVGSAFVPLKQFQSSFVVKLDVYAPLALSVVPQGATSITQLCNLRVSTAVWRVAQGLARAVLWFALCVCTGCAITASNGCVHGGCLLCAGYKCCWNRPRWVSSEPALTSTSLD